MGARNNHPANSTSPVIASKDSNLGVFESAVSAADSGAHQKALTAISANNENGAKVVSVAQ